MNILTTSKDFQNLVFIPRNNVVKAFQDRVVLDGGTYSANSCFKPIELVITADGLEGVNKLNFENRVYFDSGTYIANSCFSSFLGDDKEEEVGIVSNGGLVYTTTLTASNQTATINEVFNLVEGRYYHYEVTGQTLMYRGKIFCTDQTSFDKYVINSGDFVEAASVDSQFITP